jgi:ABC-2 type transport system permease protein
MMQSLTRIHAMLLRYFYILSGSPARLVEAVYWPTMQMVLWGFISQYFAHQNATPMMVSFGTFIGAVLLWDFLFRVQIGVSLSFMEEIWSRNLGHLFVSPLRPYEWWIAMMLFSILRASIGLLAAILLAMLFYGFSTFALGLPVLLLFFNLMMMGWWIGFFVTALLMKVGPGAEGLAWALTFFLTPFCAVYYPVSTLPAWLQVVSNALPASHVFEGLRALVRTGQLPAHDIVMAFLLNCVYMTVAIAVLQLSFNNARKQGTLLQTGE